MSNNNNKTPAQYLKNLQDLCKNPESFKFEQFISENPELFDKLIEKLKTFFDKEGIPYKSSTPAPAVPKELKPAKQSVPYSVTLEPQFKGAELVNPNPDYEILWNKETHSFSGEIKDTKFLGQFLEFTLKIGERTQVFKIWVNHNADSQWKNLPSDQTDKYAKPDEDVKFVHSAEAIALGARIRGRSHAHKGTWCDDDFGLKYSKHLNCYLLSVSDGAGSAKFSRLGSKIAVNKSLNEMVNLFSDDTKSYARLFQQTDNEALKLISHALLVKAARAAYTGLEEALTQDSDIKSVRELACTLMFSFSIKLQAGEYAGKWLTGSFWIGDGAIALYDSSKEEFKLLGENDSGQYSGETKFLTQDELSNEKINEHIILNITSEMPLMMLMTDGISDPLFPNDSALRKTSHWLELWEQVRPSLVAEEPRKSILDWIQFNKPGEHDDRTILVLSPKTIINDLAGDKLSALIQKHRAQEQLASEVIPAEETAKEVTEAPKPVVSETPAKEEAGTEVTPVVDIPEFSFEDTTEQQPTTVEVIKPIDEFVAEMVEPTLEVVEEAKEAEEPVEAAKPTEEVVEATMENAVLTAEVGQSAVEVLEENAEANEQAVENVEEILEVTEPTLAVVEETTDVVEPEVEITEVKITEVKRTEVERTEVERTEVERTEVERTEVERTEVERTEVEVTEASEENAIPVTNAVDEMAVEAVEVVELAPESEVSQVEEFAEFAIPADFAAPLVEQPSNSNSEVDSSELEAIPDEIDLGISQTNTDELPTLEDEITILISETSESESQAQKNEEHKDSESLPTNAN